MKDNNQLPALINSEVNLSTIGDLTLAQKIASSYTPIVLRVEEKITELKTLQKGNAQDCDKAKRIALDLGKECAALDRQKKADKDQYVNATTKFIDSLFKKIEEAARTSQKEAQDIASHFEQLEKQRLAILAQERVRALIDYTENPEELSKMGLEKMEQHVFDSLLIGFKASFEKRQKEAEEVAKQKAIEDAAKEVELEKLRAEIKKKEEADKAAKIIRNKRTAELGPFIAFVLDYETLISSEEEEYNTRFADIKKLAEFMWEEDRKAKAEQEKKDAELAKAKAEQEKLRKELEQKQLADKAAADLKAKEEAEKAALAKKLAKAPAKKQLKAWLESFEIPEVPGLSDKEALNTLNNLISKFEGFKTWGEAEVEKL
jgi:colicin import membrane protein